MTVGSSSAGMTNIKHKISIQYIARMIIPGLLLVCFISSCKNDPAKIQEVIDRKQAQLDKAEDVVIIYSEEDKTVARLYVKEFIRNEKARPPYLDMKNGLKVEFFDDSLNVSSTLTALYARYYEEEGNILLRDSIVVVNKKGEELRTEELIWNQKIKKFYTEKFVRINTPTQVMYGNGLEANEDFSWYRIKQPQGVVQVDKEEVPE